MESGDLSNQNMCCSKNKNCGQVNLHLSLSLLSPCFQCKILTHRIYQHLSLSLSLFLSFTCKLWHSCARIVFTSTHLLYTATVQHNRPTSHQHKCTTKELLYTELLLNDSNSLKTLLFCVHSVSPSSLPLPYWCVWKVPVPVCVCVCVCVCFSKWWVCLCVSGLWERERERKMAHVSVYDEWVGCGFGGGVPTWN